MYRSRRFTSYPTRFVVAFLLEGTMLISFRESGCGGCSTNIIYSVSLGCDPPPQCKTWIEGLFCLASTSQPRPSMQLGEGNWTPRPSFHCPSDACLESNENRGGNLAVAVNEVLRTQHRTWWSRKRKVCSQILTFLQARLITLCADNSLHLWEINSFEEGSRLEEVRSFSSLEGGRCVCFLGTVALSFSFPLLSEFVEEARLLVVSCPQGREKRHVNAHSFS